MFNGRPMEQIAAQVELLETLLASSGEPMISSPPAATAPDRRRGES